MNDRENAHDICNNCESIIYSKQFHKCGIIKDSFFIDYKNLRIEELCSLANKNDTLAQNEIIDFIINLGSDKYVIDNINIFMWYNIFEKCQKNQKYMFTLLCCCDKKIKNKIFHELFPTVKLCAKSGDALAQNNLGFMYEKGIGLEKNSHESIKWYTKSANQGFKYAQNNLGFFYLDNKDYTLAKIYLKKAAFQNDRNAEHKLGQLYFNGIGVKKNYQKAFKWFILSANKNFWAAEHDLAIMYYNGLGVDINLNLAFYWIISSAHKNYTDSQYLLGCIYDNKYFEHYDPKESVKWLTFVANKNNIDAMIKLANHYEINNDYAQTIYWIIKTKSSQYLPKIFSKTKPVHEEYNLKNTLKHYFVQDHAKKLESLLIKKCQILIIQNKYFWHDKNADERTHLCEVIEKKIFQMIKWREKIISRPLLLLSCLKFDKYFLLDSISNKEKSNNIPHIEINKHQEKTKIIPYVKQHTIRSQEYISFEQKNIKFVDKLINHQNNTNDLHGIFDLLENYYKDLIASININKYINIITKSINLITTIKTIYSQFNELLLDEIEYGAYYRNLVFSSDIEFPVSKLINQ
ncbi:Sel1-like repeat-containing protein [Cotonvirus japonicus]|uniref:Sel1-like repeat-containing protein n=1 Tax=Cotonvirus japonicus TaxID=2811091 RepID=A0ABM7NRE8_9VIRU|nr:Sel1-like repeat-containing protein [Cotonvirus japonicus]BCS82742.1 Sel1-like repeat-containing protein [Cotonvirus japonicus]